MVDGEVESVTMYDPYGNLLTQTENSGTTYGYTGEQYDDATGLLYLRARYYNPALRSFMGRDLWSGNLEGPQSMNGWNYVNGNPINLVDPTGMIPTEFPERCHAAGSILEYERCVRQEMGLEGPSTTFDEVSKEFRFHHVNVPAELRGCYFGPVPYKAPGYLEGVSGELGPANVGIEIVYDFATMEKQNFWYWAGVYSGNAAINAIGKTGNWIENYMGASISGSVGYVKGFRNWRDITRDYEGIFAVYGGQLGMSTISPLSIGATVFHGVPDYGIRGNGFSLSLSLSLGKVNPFASPFSASANMLLATYIPMGSSKPYWGYGRGLDKEVIPALVSADILAGVRSPLSAAMLVAGGLAYTGIGTPHAIGFIAAAVTARGIGAYQGYQWSKTYNAIHSDSWGPWENWMYR